MPYNRLSATKCTTPYPTFRAENKDGLVWDKGRHGQKPTRRIGWPLFRKVHLQDTMASLSHTAVLELVEAYMITDCFLHGKRERPTYRWDRRETSANL